MKKTIKLTESDLHKIVKRVIKEDESKLDFYDNKFQDLGVKISNALYELEKVMRECHDLSEELYDIIDESSNNESTDNLDKLEDIAGSCTYYSDKINDFLSDID
jgi:DNA repair ATPase RecN